jgi:iron complex transport system substrate-binding protein
VRIVSLLPSATEICYSLGLGEQLVGVTHECDFPPEALSKPKLTRSMLPESLQTHPGTNPSPNPGRSAAIDRHVRANVHQGSSLYALDSELLEQLAPDLIITQELCAVCAVSYEIVAGAAKRLRGDPRIISLEPASLDDVFDTIVTIAELTGIPERAPQALEPLRSRVTALSERTKSLSRPKTLLLEWADPPMSAGHWIPELIELAGGEPVLANALGNSQKLDWSAIAQADPDVIFVAPCGYDLPAAREAIRELDVNPAWRTLRAVRERRVFAIDGNAYISRPGPRLVDSAEILSRALHGAAV